MIYCTSSLHEGSYFSASIFSLLLAVWICSVVWAEGRHDKTRTFSSQPSHHSFQFQLS